MTHVLQLIETAGVGGAEMVFLQLARRLNRHRFTLHNVLMRDGWLQGQLQSDGLPCELMPSASGDSLGFIRRLARVIGQRGIDVLHAHLPDACFYGALSGRLGGARVVSTHHGLLRPRETVKDRFKLQAVRRSVSHSVAVSETLRRQLIDQAGFRAGHTTTIYNGVDWNLFDREADPIALKGSLKLPLEDRIVGMVGNMRPSKGYVHFVRAAGLVLRTHGNCRFLIIGEQDPAIMAELEREAGASGLTNRLHMLGPRSDVHALLQLFDVFVLSSVSEGMSIATVEAMGMGVPVVVTRCGGPEELVSEGVTGLLVPPRDERALAEAVTSLLSQRERARTLATAAREHARGTFSVEGMVSGYEAVYDRVHPPST